VFAGQGLVREAQVIAYLESQHATPSQEDNAGPAATPGAASTRSAIAKYGLFRDAAISATERGQSLFRVGLNYFFRNWLLGNLVRWAPRGIILPLHRLRGVKMGSSCFIDPTAIVETAYPENITLGDDVRITAGAVIMTHIKAPHYLRKTGIVPPVLKPVVLEDHCFIGVNAVVMPGVTVGVAAVVASGAVAVNNVPPYTMVSGNPAKIVKRFPKPRD
jgi:acetyltransferase-like isoleucine patch superfamily enzyme